MPICLCRIPWHHPCNVASKAQSAEPSLYPGKFLCSDKECHVLLDVVLGIRVGLAIWHLIGCCFAQEEISDLKLDAYKRIDFPNPLFPTSLVQPFLFPQLDDVCLFLYSKNAGLLRL